MKRFLVLALALVPGFASAFVPVQLQAYLAQAGVDPFAAGSKGQYRVFYMNGEYRLSGEWSVPGVAAPLESDFLPEGEAALAVAEWAAGREAALEAAHQASKPAARKAYENEFFAFVRLVLAAAGDPRASETPTPKLGFDELTPMIEGIQAADPMAAINLTLKGLSIDSALKRYDSMWWDDAVEHE